MSEGEIPPFASLLRALRRDAALTQEELAERAGMSVRGISDLERGVKKRPYRATVRRIAAALALAPAQQVLLERAARGETPRMASTVLVGRSAEVAGIERVLGGQGPPLLFLSGEPGIGKTRLLQESVQRVGGRALLWGACTPRSL